MMEATQAGLDISVLLDVLAKGDVRARCALARQVGLLLADMSTAAVERDQIVPVALKLAVDQVFDVRLALVEEVAAIRKLDADLLFAIIADSNDIALPFLMVTPALNAWHMMAVMRVGDELRQQTVAARPDITAETTAYAVKSASAAVIAELLCNPAVRIDANAYRAIYARLGNVSDLVELLLGKSDLPADIRIMQAKRTASRMRQLLAEKGWIAANDASATIADAEENAILQILVSADDAGIAATTSFMADKNLLLPSLVLRAASRGEMRVVEHILAHLSGFGVEKARYFMFARGVAGLRSLLGKSGLPPACLGIVAAACDVVREVQAEGYQISQEVFGRRMLEALMTRYEFLSPADRAKQIEYLGRYGEERVRNIARKLKHDLARAA
jgi:uncharacterized protein (DUF2336 family)